MKRRGLTLLLVVSLLFSGCLWVRSDNGLTTIELRGELGQTHELVVWHDSLTYLVGLGAGGKTVLSLEAGTWQIQAFSRDSKGDVVSFSDVIQARGGRQAIVSLALTRVEARPTPIKAENVVHTWTITGGVELTWESDTDSLQATGNWEIWKRHKQSIFWQKVEQVPATATHFEDFDPKAHEYLYAVRFVAIGEERLPLATSRLVASSGPDVGQLEVAWDYEHYFAPVSSRASFSSLGLMEDARPEPAYTDLIALFRTEMDFAQRRGHLAELGLAIKRELPSLLAVVCEPEPQSELSLEEWSTYEDASLFIEPNWIVQAASIQSTTSRLTWELDYIRVPAVHERITTGDQSVRIAVLDSGLNPGALPSSVRVLEGYNFVDKNRDTRDDYAGFYHGTTVAQTISAAIPVVSLQPVKVLGADGRGDDKGVSDGMLYAAGLHDTIPNPTPVQIINLSLGQPEESSLMRRTVERIRRETDIVIIAASGNTPSGANRPGLFYPAAHRQVLAVGAIHPSTDGPERAFYSNYGQTLDVVAPPSFEEGTSHSSALVSGVAGLMYSQGIPLRDIRSVLTTTAMDLGVPGWDEEYGYGLINALWAVKDIRELQLLVEGEDGDQVSVGVPLEETAKRFYLPPGDYTVQAWVNVQGRDVPSQGDYVASSSSLTVFEDEEVGVSLTLSELSGSLAE